MEFKEFIFVHVLSNISSMRHSVSSPDETPRREYDAQRSIFDEHRGVSSGDETLCLMLDISMCNQMVTSEIRE